VTARESRERRVILADMAAAAARASSRYSRFAAAPSGAAHGPSASQWTFFWE